MRKRERERIRSEKKGDGEEYKTNERREEEEAKYVEEQGRQVVYVMHTRALVVSCCVTGSRVGTGHQIVPS